MTYELAPFYVCTPYLANPTYLTALFLRKYLIVEIVGNKTIAHPVENTAIAPIIEIKPPSSSKFKIVPVTIESKKLKKVILNGDSLYASGLNE